MSKLTINLIYLRCTVLSIWGIEIPCVYLSRCEYDRSKYR